MSEPIKAIETQYKGYRFRSRAEARTAVFLDSLELKYIYEPEGYHVGKKKYLPDFQVVLTAHRNANPRFYLEVKGIEPEREYYNDVLLPFVKGGNSLAVCIGSLGEEEVWHLDLKSPYAVCQDKYVSKEIISRNLVLCAKRTVATQSVNVFWLDQLADHFAALRGWDLRSLPLRPAEEFHALYLYVILRVKLAYKASRSARFEFGESGAA